MAFDDADFDGFAFQDDSDFGIANLPSVDSFHDALEEPAAEFWDEMFCEADEIDDAVATTEGPKYFSWSSALATSVVDVTQPHVL